MKDTELRPFDVDHVRACFPALSTPWAIFDNAGGSAPARHVIERVTDHLRRLPWQLGGSYPLSVEAGDAVEGGHRAAARLFGAEADEIVLGASSTALAARLARALRPLWEEGDEVVVTNVDHEANIGGWRALERSGIVVREWGVGSGSCALELEDLEPLLGERTRLVAFTHCSNIVGSIHDVKRIAVRVREAGALSCVDGVAYAPHRRIDVKALGVDFYFASLYKVYGPHLAALYGRRDLLREARGQNHFFFSEDDVPGKLEPGATSYELAGSLPGILDYLGELAAHHGRPEDDLDAAFELVASREAELSGPLVDFLVAHPRVRLLGHGTADPALRAPTFSFTVDGMRSSEVTRRLDEHRVAARHGHFYAYRLIERLGLHANDGVVRASLLHYNTEDEVTRLVAGLEEVLR